jgi:hypothetical protein
MTLSPRTKAILTSPKLLASREAHFARLRALFDGQSGSSAFTLSGICGESDIDVYEEPEMWVAEALDDLAERSDVLLDSEVFRPLVIEFGPYGVHFIDRMFGAEVFDLDGTPNWQVRCLDTPVGTLTPPDLTTDPTWRLARRIATAFAKAGVSVPLFGLPTIGSALNIAVNLYGQAFLIALAENPSSAKHDLEVINRLLCALHRWYREHVPRAQLEPVIGAYRTQPRGYGQVCGCSTQLLSPEMYRDCVAPLDEAVLSVYPHGGMIHLCGSHTQHIPAWREMGALRAAQFHHPASEDLREYFTGLRDDQILYVNVCEEMPVERAIEATGGERTVIVVDPREQDKDEEPA